MDFRLISILLGQMLCLVFSIFSMFLMMIGFSGMLVDLSKQSKMDSVHMCFSIVAVIGYIASMKLLLILEGMLP